MKQRRKTPAPRKPHSETQVAVKKENPKRPAISPALSKFLLEKTKHLSKDTIDF